MSDWKRGSLRVMNPLTLEQFRSQSQLDTERLFGPHAEAEPSPKQTLPTYFVEAQPEWFVEQHDEGRIMTLPLLLLDWLYAEQKQLPHRVPALTVKSTYAVSSFSNIANSERFNTYMVRGTWYVNKHKEDLPQAIVTGETYSAKLDLIHARVYSPDWKIELSHFTRNQKNLGEKPNYRALPWYCKSERKVIDYGLMDRLEVDSKTPT